MPDVGNARNCFDRLVLYWHISYWMAEIGLIMF